MIFQLEIYKYITHYSRHISLLTGIPLHYNISIFKDTPTYIYVII